MILIAPLDGTPKVTQWYGERPEYYAQFGLRGHNGIDYSAVVGTPVKAVADGYISWVDNDPPGYGRYVRIWHPALRVFSFYGHLSEPKVVKGDTVKQGDIIGLSGDTGNSTGPHLHYEIRVADAAGHYLAVEGMKNGAIDPVSFAAGLDRGAAEPFVPVRYEPTPAFLRALDFVLAHEGGWSDNPADPGGATMKGITLGTYVRWCADQRRPEPTKDDLRTITDDEVQQIYLGDYWLKSGADKLAWPLQLAHFDAAVNSGVGQAAKLLASSGGDFQEYMGQRITWYTNISNWETFGRGWIRRCADVLKEAE
jgi:hypothetical protein